MQSAAILAVQTKEKAKAESAPGEEPQSMTIAGATIAEDNKIYLHGNPLGTTTETICLTCRLPRLNYPLSGKNMRSMDSTKKYCAKHPFIDKEGCDIYGRPLAIEKPSKKKAAKQKANNGSGSGSESGNDDGGGKKEKGTAMPSAKCPTCPRYLYFSRIAHHLERCSGIGGRASSRNAKEKLNSNTPKESSRASTPKPGSQGSKLPVQTKASKTNGSQTNSIKKRKKGSEDDDDDEQKTPVKKKKLGKKDAKGKAMNADVARVKGAEKRLPGQENSKSSTPEVKSED